MNFWRRVLRVRHLSAYVTEHVRDWHGAAGHGPSARGLAQGWRATSRRRALRAVQGELHESVLRIFCVLSSTFHILFCNRIV